MPPENITDVAAEKHWSLLTGTFTVSTIAYESTVFMLWILPYRPRGNYFYRNNKIRMSALIWILQLEQLSKPQCYRKWINTFESIERSAALGIHFVVSRSHYLLMLVQQGQTCFRSKTGIWSIYKAIYFFNLFYFFFIVSFNSVMTTESHSFFFLSF